MAWIDTCCIDKSSSAELQEAVNSMYQWYENAVICCAFLADVPSPSDKTKFESYKSRSQFIKVDGLQEVGPCKSYWRPRRLFFTLKIGP